MFRGRTTDLIVGIEVYLFNQMLLMMLLLKQDILRLHESLTVLNCVGTSVFLFHSVSKKGVRQGSYFCSTAQICPHPVPS